MTVLLLSVPMGEQTHDSRLEELHRNATLVLDKLHGERLLGMRQDDITSNLLVDPPQIVPADPDAIYRVPVQSISEVLWGLKQVGSAGSAAQMLEVVQDGVMQPIGMFVTPSSRQNMRTDAAMAPYVRIAEEALVGLGTLEDALGNPALGIGADDPRRVSIQRALRDAGLYDDAGLKVDDLWELYRGVQDSPGADSPA